MKVPAIRYFVLGALLCAALGLTLVNIGCSTDSPVKVRDNPPQEQPDVYNPGKAHDSAAPLPFDGENGDM
jgi:hypothetical protein